MLNSFDEAFSAKFMLEQLTHLPHEIVGGHYGLFYVRSKASKRESRKQRYIMGWPTSCTDCPMKDRMIRPRRCSYCLSEHLKRIMW